MMESELVSAITVRVVATLEGQQPRIGEVRQPGGVEERSGIRFVVRSPIVLPTIVHAEDLPQASTM